MTMKMDDIDSKQGEDYMKTISQTAKMLGISMQAVYGTCDRIGLTPWNRKKPYILSTEEIEKVRNYREKPIVLKRRKNKEKLKLATELIEAYKEFHVETQGKSLNSMGFEDVKSIEKFQKKAIELLEEMVQRKGELG